MTMPAAHPICMLCRRVRYGNDYTQAPTCAAFPDEIPKSILEGLADHRQEILGDHGIRFEPRDGVTAAELEQWERDKREALT